ncbi:hypothetical protein NDU88_008107 [Pleurodeles waltl]|uniref:Uncharacterized protein n=1 Tax=Pleurodeles waltl TaxID=8319 RepID=A0AAV7RU87_PLEWA|nr:hypothetical protein NDU88_008107 [Pleurodeles waltl]
MGRVSSREVERHPPALQIKRGRGRHGRRRGASTAEAVAHAPDLEQLIQERPLLGPALTHLGVRGGPLTGSQTSVPPVARKNGKRDPWEAPALIQLGNAWFGIPSNLARLSFQLRGFRNPSTDLASTNAPGGFRFSNRLGHLGVPSNLTRLRSGFRIPSAAARLVSVRSPSYCLTAFRRRA